MSLSGTELALFELTTENTVEELPDTENDEIGDEFAHFDKCQKGETEPQTEHSTEVWYVLSRLYTQYAPRRK